MSEYILLVDLLPPLALSNEREGGIRGVAEIYTPLINAIRRSTSRAYFLLYRLFFCGFMLRN